MKKGAIHLNSDRVIIGYFPTREQAKKVTNVLDEKPRVRGKFPGIAWFTRKKKDEGPGAA